MPESALHYRMVMSIRNWIIEKYEKLFIWIDLPSCEESSIPLRIEGFIPDVYAKILSNSKEIIGEAKTARDLDSRHTEEQLCAFLRYCSNNDNTFFILAVPWDFTRNAKSLIEYLKIKCHARSANTIILEKLG